MLFLKLNFFDWRNASKDKRELSVVRELGVEPLVIATGNPGDRGRKDQVDGFTVLRYSAKPLGNSPRLQPLNRMISLFTWAHYMKKLHADIISCHDIAALGIGYLSTLFTPKRKKAKLIYDSHEFEIGRNKKRSKLAVRWVAFCEKFLMKRCVLSTMVNDSIADEVQRIHHLPTRPLVVRNMPDNWPLDFSKIEERRKEFLSQLGLDHAFLVMYHGALRPARGIENMLRALKETQGTAAILLGNGEPDYIQSLHALTEELGIQNRVLFHEAVPIEILSQYVGAAHVDLAVGLAICKSYFYMLPNKFFESIQSLTPVIVSDYPETGRLTREYDIGLTVDPTDASQIAQAITRLQQDDALYRRLKENLKKAKEELCWEREKQGLKEAYEEVIRQCGT